MYRSLITLIALPFCLEADTITVEIDYAGHLPPKTVTAEYHAGQTALEVLKSVARVQTRTAGGYTFVTAVDGVVSEPGTMGWFYTLQGEKAKTMASRTPLRGEARMRWYYGVEACY